MKRTDLIAVAVCFLLAAALFTNLLVTLLVGLLAAAIYHAVYRRNRKVMVLLVSLLASYLLLEFFGGIAIRRHIARTHHVDLDHRMKANPAAGINSDGIRCPVEASDFTADTYNIIFLGDSFTYGERLADGGEAFPAQLEALCRAKYPAAKVRAVNFAWVSSSPLLSARLLKDIGQKYKPRLVVYCLDMTDFHDDLRYLVGAQYIGVSPTAFLLAKAGLAAELSELKKRWNFPELWARLTGRGAVVPGDRFFVVNQPLGESIEYMQATENNLREIDAFCREQLNAKFVLVMLPRGFQYSDKESRRSWEAYAYTPLGPYVLEPFKWLKSFRARAGFPCYSLLEDFQNSTVFPTCFDDDPHWTKEGHAVAARGMLRILDKEGTLTREPLTTNH
ncbi:MAG TPA: hypothetical protein VJZ71_20570 [Phycisphaerae bacterium]|nr:hypothetical protein [Phycisphaerae bacterium]